MYILFTEIHHFEIGAAGAQQRTDITLAIEMKDRWSPESACPLTCRRQERCCALTSNRYTWPRQVESYALIGYDRILRNL